MIDWLQKNIDSLPKDPEENQEEEKHESENQGSENSDEEDDVISPEEQAKIDAEMQKKAEKSKNAIRAPVCAEVYG